MKELFQATSSNSITDVKHREVLQIVLETWKNNVVKLKMKVENMAYPVHIKSLWIVIGLVIICDKFLLSTSMDVVNLMMKYGVPGLVTSKLFFFVIKVFILFLALSFPSFKSTSLISLQDLFIGSCTLSACVCC